MKLVRAVSVICSKPLTGSNGSSRYGCDVAVGAGPVLDHDRLATVNPGSDGTATRNEPKPPAK